MSFEPKDQKSDIEELFQKIDAFRSVDSVIRESQKVLTKHSDQEKDGSSAPVESVVDEDIFDSVKNGEKQKEAREKSALRRLLDEEEDDEEDVVKEHSLLYDDIQEDIDDFETEDDRDEIYRDLKNTVGKMAVKSVFFFLISVVSLALFVIGIRADGTFFGGGAIWFQLSLLAVDIVCGFLSFGIFMQGLIRLIHFKADTDTLLALFYITLVSMRIITIFKVDLQGYSLYLEPLLAISLYFNVLSKKKIASNIKKNFKLISVSSDKLTAGLQLSSEAKNDLILETGEGGDVVYARHTGLVSKFIDHSYGDFEYDHSIYRYLFVTVVLILAGTVALFQLAGWKEGLMFPAAAFALSVPFFSRYYYAASIYKNGQKIRKNGGILTSAVSAKELEEADMMIISEEDFFEKDTVLLQGVKALGDLEIDTLITYIAALYHSVGTPFKNLFLKMIDQSTVSLPRVDDDLYFEGMGYSCYIESKVFLLGNLDLMKQFNVAFPKQFEKLRLKEHHFPVYIAYDGHPVGIFIASFEQNVHTEKAIKIANSIQLGVGLVHRDFLLTKDLLKSLYPAIDFQLFHFVSVNTGTKCRPYLKRCDKHPELIASIKGTQGLVACLYGVKKLLSALRINRIIRVLYPILSIGLIFFIALAGYSTDTASQILMFQGIWTSLVYLICTFCK